MARQLQFICPHCGTVNDIPASKLGKVDCLKCDGLFTAPVPVAKQKWNSLKGLAQQLPIALLACLILLVGGALFGSAKSVMQEILAAQILTCGFIVAGSGIVAHAIRSKSS